MSATPDQITIPTDPDAPCTLSADQVPLQMADELTDDAALTPILETDFSPFKPQCDVVVLGPAHAPDGKPVKLLFVLLVPLPRGVIETLIG